VIEELTDLVDRHERPRDLWQLRTTEQLGGRLLEYSASHEIAQEAADRGDASCHRGRCELLVLLTQPAPELQVVELFRLEVGVVMGAQMLRQTPEIVRIPFDRAGCGPPLDAQIRQERLDVIDETHPCSWRWCGD